MLFLSCLAWRLARSFSLIWRFLSRANCDARRGALLAAVAAVCLPKVQPSLLKYCQSPPRAGYFSDYGVLILCMVYRPRVACLARRGSPLPLSPLRAAICRQSAARVYRMLSPLLSKPAACGLFFCPWRSHTLHGLSPLGGVSCQAVRQSSYGRQKPAPNHRHGLSLFLLFFSSLGMSIERHRQVPLVWQI